MTPTVWFATSTGITGQQKTLLVELDLLECAVAQINHWQAAENMKEDQSILDQQVDITVVRPKCIGLIDTSGIPCVYIWKTLLCNFPLLVLIVYIWQIKHLLM